MSLDEMSLGQLFELAMTVNGIMALRVWPYLAVVVICMIIVMIGKAGKW